MSYDDLFNSWLRHELEPPATEDDDTVGLGSMTNEELWAHNRSITTETEN